MNNWAKGNTVDPLKGYENSTTDQYKCKYQGEIRHNAFIQIYCIYKMCPKSEQTVPKCRDNEDQISKIANFLKTANDLG